MEIKNVNVSSSSRGSETSGRVSSGSVNNTPGNVPVTKVLSSSTLANMTKGSIFAGDIIDVRGSAIKILLSGNETVSAKTSNTSSLNIGDYIKFMVKENTGNQILIKALNIDNRNTNPLIGALESANIPVNERNMQMVLEMMRNEMPIDKASIYDMYKNISMFEESKADTIVNIVRHDIPLNSENITQFENYINYEHRINEEINGISKDIPNILKNAISNTNEQVIKDVALKLLADYPDVNLSTKTTASSLNLVADDNIDLGLTTDDNSFEINLTNPQNESNVSETSSMLSKEYNSISNVSTTISEELNSLIDKINYNINESDIINDASHLVNKDEITKETFIKALNSLNKEDLSLLFDTKEFKKYIRESLSKEFNIDVLKLTNDGDALKEKIINLYNALDDKTEKLLDLLKLIPNDSKELSDKVQNLRNNLNFMNDINQMASYVQLPLKFSETNNHGELYVYNKKQGNQVHKDVITAFMHLDMDNLGVTDVDIRLENNNLSTTFSLADDLSVRIVEEHLYELKDRLEKSGFYVSLNVKKEETYENPFEKVLSADKPKMSIKRYSFDVRA